MPKHSKQITCNNGEVFVFEDFFKEYFSKFYDFAMRFIEDRHACEDIVQDTFISIWEGNVGLKFSVQQVFVFVNLLPHLSPFSAAANFGQKFIFII